MRRGLLCCALFVGVSSCKETGPVNPQASIAEIGFRSGLSATYAWQIEERDSTGNLLLVERDTLICRVAGENEILHTDSGLVRMEAFSISDYHGVTNVWYKDSANRLLEIAYSRAGVTPIVLPKRKKDFTESATPSDVGFIMIPKSIQRLWKTIGSDSVLFRDDRRVVYEYPLEQGKSWISFQSPFRQTREVIEVTVLTTHAGLFFCASISTRLPGLAPDIEWFDSVDEAGLVRRSISIPKILVSTPQNPDGIGWISVSEKLELLSRTNAIPLLR